MKTVMNEAGTVLPDDDYYYLIGSNGAFFSMKAPWADAVIPAKEIEGLKPVEKRCKWKLPPMPAEVFARIAYFFNRVAKKHGTEVAVLLHFNFQTKEWAVTVPEQVVTPGHVDYKPTDRIPGFRCVGTMHSHVQMSAFHSGTDEEDEAEIDGLHVTIGHVHKYPRIDVDAKIVVRGVTFNAAGALFAHGLRALSDTEQDEDRPWLYRYSSGENYVIENNLKPDIPSEWFKKLKVKTWKSYLPSSYSYSGKASGDYSDKGSGDSSNNGRDHDDDGIF